MSRTLLFSLIALSSFPGYAQTTRGAIAGRVTDSSGSVLQGAQIQLQSRDEKIASDTQGEFLFPDLAPGDYKVDVSYVGFSNLEASVNIKAGETARALKTRLSTALAWPTTFYRYCPRKSSRHCPMPTSLTL